MLEKWFFYISKYVFITCILHPNISTFPYNESSWCCCLWIALNQFCKRSTIIQKDALIGQNLVEKKTGKSEGHRKKSSWMLLWLYRSIQNQIFIAADRTRTRSRYHSIPLKWERKIIILVLSKLTLWGLFLKKEDRKKKEELNQREREREREREMGWLIGDIYKPRPPWAVSLGLNILCSAFLSNWY